MNSDDVVAIYFSNVTVDTTRVRDCMTEAVVRMTLIFRGVRARISCEKRDVFAHTLRTLLTLHLQSTALYIFGMKHSNKDLVLSMACVRKSPHLPLSCLRIELSHKLTGFRIDGEQVEHLRYRDVTVGPVPDIYLPIRDNVLWD